jgi:Plasmid pRiA4b ORF-3-like protein/SEC-C motif
VSDRFSDRLNRRRVTYRAAYLPEREFLLAREMRLLDATVQPQHENYRRELEVSLRGYGNDHLASVVVMPLDVAGLLAFAEAEGKDPTRRQTRMDYNRSLSEAGRAVAWPPPRNGSCWCGSGRKYKQCCGAPEFWSATIPDPASLILKVELVGVDPPVWRRLAVPSHLRADRLHLLIQDAMGWQNQHSYEFANDEITLGDPGSISGLVPADSERVIALACEPGQGFHYVYDLGDYWIHTITVEEIRAAGGDNQPAYLDGRGACPPEDCGGPAGYRRLLAAPDSPTDPGHEEATDWLGADFDPATAPR